MPSESTRITPAIDDHVFPFKDLPRELRNHVYALAFDEVYNGRCEQDPDVGNLMLIKGKLRFQKPRYSNIYPALLTWLLLDHSIHTEALGTFKSLFSFHAGFYFQSAYRVFDYPMFSRLEVRGGPNCDSRTCQFAGFLRHFRSPGVLDQIKTLNIYMTIGAVCFDKWERNRYSLTYKMFKELQVVIGTLRDTVRDCGFERLKTVTGRVIVQGMTVSSRDLDGVIEAFEPLVGILNLDGIKVDLEWEHAVVGDERDLFEALLVGCLEKKVSSPRVLLVEVPKAKGLERISKSRD